MEHCERWYYSNNRKLQQRKLNKFIREINKSIEKDNLWLGRFFIRQIRVNDFYRFEDGSGSELFVTLRFFDKKDNMYIDYWGSTSDWCFPGNGYGLWNTLNRFITEESSAWKSEDRPALNKEDFTNVSNDLIYSTAKPKYDRLYAVIL